MLTNKSHTNGRVRATNNRSRTSVLVIGDVMLDRFVYGSVERISPEAPTPVLSYAREEVMPGGAANVAVNVHDLGNEVVLIGVVGKDRAGRELGTLLKKRGVQRAHLIVDHARPTTSKTRYVAQNHHLIRVDSESAFAISPSLEKALREEITHELKRARTVVCADYNKGVLSGDLIAWLIAEAKRLNIPLIADAKPKTLRQYKGAYLITPNTKEIIDTTGIPDAHTGATFFATKLDTRVLLTEGPEGMTLFEKGHVPYHMDARARGVVDVSGAGDTVVAALAVYVGEGKMLREAVELANAAAAVAVRKPGTASVSKAEVRLEASGAASGMVAKVQSASELRALLRRQKQNGMRIVFTNGVFDLLHEGHVTLLERAKLEGDVLVVGVNTDKTVRRLKGPTRPILPLSVRMHMLSALASVDYVVSFAEETPLRLVQLLEPDVLVKGGDYREKEIVGARETKVRGGRVVIVPTLPGHSTTNIVRRIHRR